jgi:hypothetical protein
MDFFLQTKIDKKLLYWMSQRINIIGRETIANAILISSMLYFIAIWGGTKRGIASITKKVRQFFSSGTIQRTSARVSWQVCCLKRCDRGFNLINPNEAIIALISKWIVAA